MPVNKRSSMIGPRPTDTCDGCGERHVFRLMIEYQCCGALLCRECQRVHGSDCDVYDSLGFDPHDGAQRLG
jgi:hypothetical protein